MLKAKVAVHPHVTSMSASRVMVSTDQAKQYVRQGSETKKGLRCKGCEDRSPYQMQPPRSI